MTATWSSDGSYFPSDTECSPLCTAHSEQIILSATRAHDSEQLIRLLTLICASRRPWRVKDSYGRSILHIAATMGKLDILSWYLKHRGATSRNAEVRRALLDDTDKESGWTPLHRAVFQGEWTAAFMLLQHGADSSVRDHDGFSPVQLAIYDRGCLDDILDRSYEEPDFCFPVAFYVWGSNMNFTLGFGDDQERHAPDKLRVPFPSTGCLLAHKDVESGIACTNCGNANLHALRCIARGEIHLQPPYRKEEELLAKNKKSTFETVFPRAVAEYRIREKMPLPVIDIVMRKFHTLFLAPEGVVFACGHGHGGRLGLRNESTCLHPTRVPFPDASRSEIVAVAAGVNHSVFLSKTGVVFTCGSNEYYQLGIQPPPINVFFPTEVSPIQNLVHGHLKRQGSVVVEVDFIGVSAERCHTLVWTKDSLYACGFNGGQLGLKPNRSTKARAPSGSVSSGKELIVIELHQLLLKEITEVGSLFPPRFVRCSDAAVLLCGPSFDLVVLHEYELKRLPKLPRLSRVRPDQFYRLTEVCVFGGNLELPGKEAALKRDLVITALAFDVPFLYIDKTKGSWVQIALFGIPRDMNSIYHMSLSSDVLLLSTQYGECYRVTLSKPESSKLKKYSETFTYKAERITKVWRAVKMFSEPASRNFAAIQVVPPFHYRPCITSFFDNHWMGSSRTFSQESSPHPNVKIVIDELSFGAERLFLLTGSWKFREMLLQAEKNRKKKNSTALLVVDVSGKMDLGRMENELSDAYHSRDWTEIRREAYPTAMGIWDVEPDMKVCCDEDDFTINAHRWILVTRVLYFSNLLEGNRWKDSDEARAPVLPCNARVGLAFMQFIYTGSITDGLWKFDDCMGFLRLADFLVHDEMRTAASKYFKPSLNYDLLWPLYKVAIMYNSAALKKDCAELMTYMLPEMIEARQLENLDHDTANTVSQQYQEQFEELFVTRMVTPYEFENINMDMLDRVQPGIFLEDDEPDSRGKTNSHSSSSGKKSSKKIVMDSPPKSGTVNKEPSFHSPSTSGSQQMLVVPENQISSAGTSGDHETSLKERKQKNRFVSVSKLDFSQGDGENHTGQSSTGEKLSSSNTQKDQNPIRSANREENLSIASTAKPDRILSAISTIVPAPLSSIMEEQKRETSSRPEKSAALVRGANNPHRKKFVGQKLDMVEAPVLPEPVFDPVVSLRSKGNPWKTADTASSGLGNIIGKEKENCGPSVRLVFQKSASPGKDAVVPQSPNKTSVCTAPPKTPHSWHLPTSSIAAPQRISGYGKVGEPLSSPLLGSFEQILQDERDQQTQLQKSRSRPMNLIQVEERAVTELAEFYGAQDNPEELIIVVRILPREAPVSWSARVMH